MRLLDGYSQTMGTRAPLGSPANPLSQAQREAKFRDCAANALRPIAMDTIDQSLAILSKLELQPDIQALVGFFTHD